ncbi:MAG: AbrB/MazE/SpoVT family DNA-binding domain-containing protein [Acidobacteriota bacterium]
MNSTARIQHKGQVTIPTRLRTEVGLSKGDLVEFSLHKGKIVITPKVVIDRSQFPNADGEHTPAQRRAIDRGVARSEQEYQQGRNFGPFATHEKFIAALHKEAKKSAAKKTKCPAR